MEGVLLVDKEEGSTSFFCVNKIKRHFKIKKVGHCGTLDPLATGLLILVLGRATKLSQLITNFSKVYETQLLLGKETDSQDITGLVTKKTPTDHITEKAVTDTIFSFKGAQLQIPPMFSAIKKNGQKLYDLARKGQTIKREPRKIQVDDIQIHSIDIPRANFTLHVSKGTYIRTICHDIGTKLNSSGCMEKLVRHNIGPFSLKEAKTITEYLKMSPEELSEHIIPISAINKIFSDD